MKKRFIGLTFSVAILLCSIFLFGFVQESQAARPRHPLVGVWCMTYKDGKHTVKCYKLLQKNGVYVNLKSLDREGKQFKISHWGKYTIGDHEYVEHLMEERGIKCWPPVNILLAYDFPDSRTLALSFRLNGRKYNETWHKVRKAPKYDKQHWKREVKNRL